MSLGTPRRRRLKVSTLVSAELTPSAARSAKCSQRSDSISRRRIARASLVGQQVNLPSPPVASPYLLVGLAKAAGLRAWHAGSLENAAAAEALTSVLIFMNKR